MELIDLALNILLQHLSIKHHFGHLCQHSASLAIVGIGNVCRVGPIRREDAAFGQDVDPLAYGLEPTIEDIFGEAGLLGGNGSRFQAKVHGNKTKRI